MPGGKSCILFGCCTRRYTQHVTQPNITTHNNNELWCQFDTSQRGRKKWECLSAPSFLSLFSFLFLFFSFSLPFSERESVSPASWVSPAHRCPCRLWSWTRGASFLVVAWYVPQWCLEWWSEPQRYIWIDPACKSRGAREEKERWGRAQG